MRFNEFILSIPPYLSTSWKNIAHIHIEGLENNFPILVVTLVNGSVIKIPRLDGPIIEAIFSAHAKFLEREQQPHSLPLASMNAMTERAVVFDFKASSILNLENFGSVIQHNPEQADAPNLPSDLLSKIASLVKTIGIEDTSAIPQPEPHCNCPHCQIARAMHDGVESSIIPQGEVEEIVSDEDLSFRSWDIRESGDKLFVVTNPIDEKEHYSVYLGEPVGCTCGEKHCEHIRAVLRDC